MHGTLLKCVFEDNVSGNWNRVMQNVVNATIPEHNVHCLHEEKMSEGAWPAGGSGEVRSKVHTYTCLLKIVQLSLPLKDIDIDHNKFRITYIRNMT